MVYYIIMYFGSISIWYVLYLYISLIHTPMFNNWESWPIQLEWVHCTLCIRYTVDEYTYIYMSADLTVEICKQIKNLKIWLPIVRPIKHWKRKMSLNMLSYSLNINLLFNTSLCTLHNYCVVHNHCRSLNVVPNPQFLVPTV